MPAAVVAATVTDSVSPGLLGRRVAPGVPASHEQRGHAEETGTSETTLLVRRRPPSEPEQPYRNALPAASRALEWVTRPLVGSEFCIAGDP